MNRLLHAGCGPNKKPKGYESFRETRLDCDPQCKPDIVASIVAMPMVETGSFAAVFCQHCLEHLFHHEVALALAEFNRVLEDGGICEVIVPDLQGIGGRLAADEAEVPLYGNMVWGAISPLDMIFGHRASVARGNLHMAHRTGFTSSVLKAALCRAGFEKVLVERVGFDLKGQAVKEVMPCQPSVRSSGLT
jgi:Methyltransferase domain